MGGNKPTAAAQSAAKAAKAAKKANMKANKKAAPAPTPPWVYAAVIAAAVACYMGYDTLSRTKVAASIGRSVRRPPPASSRNSDANSDALGNKPRGRLTKVDGAGKHPIPRSVEWEGAPGGDLMSAGSLNWMQSKPEARAHLAKKIGVYDAIRWAAKAHPRGSLVSEDPPIALFDDFLTPEETDHVINLGHEAGLARSTGTGEVIDGKFERTDGADYRTSENSWCMGWCADDAVVKKLDKRMSQFHGFAPKNGEFYQILRYKQKQFYDTHHDFIEGQNTMPSGPRVFTFFLYLNDMDEGQGGETNFPDVIVNKTTNQVGVKVRPKKGRAIMWPNVDEFDMFTQNELTRHAALPVEDKKAQKFSANVWVHLHDFKTPHELGLTG